MRGLEGDRNGVLTPHPLTPAASRRRDNVVRVRARAARGAVGMVVERGVAYRMPEFATVRRAMTIAPCKQRMERRPQVAAGRRELVERAPGVVGIGPPLKDAIVDEAAEPVGQDGLGDVEVDLEVVEAAHAEERVAEDQERPTLADDLKRACQRAVLGGVVLAEHNRESSRMSSLIELKCATVPQNLQFSH
jgi:hypothetical protein